MEKDLGVIMDRELKFHNHVAQAAKKASVVLHKWKIFKSQHTLDVRKHTFNVRIINDWNSLSAEVVNAESLNIFKNKLNKLWVQDMYRTPFNPC